MATTHGKSIVTMIAGFGLTGIVYPGATMARIVQTLPVSAKAYRHFAVLTLIITAALAFFADGENREQVESTIKQQKIRTESAKISKPAPLIGTKFTDARKSRGWGDEPGIDGGGSTGFTDMEIVTGPGERLPPHYKPRPMAPAMLVTSANASALPDVPPPGMSEEEFERLKLALAAQKRGDSPRQVTSQDLERMRAASAARSGQDGNAID